MINVTDHILSAMGNGRIALLVLLDVSNGFDVSHEKLIEKLALYGVQADWFMSYFRDHHQHVLINNRENGPQLSGKQPNPIRVYHGTALGPFTFTIFANDMGLYAESDVLITQYADDTQVIVTGRRTDLDRTVSRMIGECTEGPVRMVQPQSHENQC